MNFRRMAGIIRPLAWALVPALFWLVSWPEYRVPAVLSLPLLIFLSVPMLASLLALHLTVVVTMAFVSVPRAPDALFAGAAVLGLWFGFKHRLFVRVTDPTKQPWRPVARMAGSVRFVALCAAFLLPLFALFRGFPGTAYLVVAAGYFGLSRFLAQFAPTLVKSARSAAVNAAVAIGAALLGTALLEFGARYLVKLPAPTFGILDIAIANPGALWSPRPNLDLTVPLPSKNGEHTPVTMQHSSIGLRGPEIEPKQPGEIRIVMLGDSFTYGWGVTQGEDIPAQLQNTLREAFPDRLITVLNLGVPAYSPWQELARLQELGLGLEPDLVILQIFPSNDITESIMKFGRALPAFGQWEKDNLFQWRQQQTRAARLERWLRDTFRAYEVFRATQHGGRGIPGIVHRFRWTNHSGAVNVGKGAARFYWLESVRQEWYPDLELSWAECQKDIQEIAAVCRTHNIPLLAYAAPLFVFSDEDWQRSFAESSKAAGEAIAYEPFKDTRLMEEFFADQGMDWVPLLAPLRETGRPESLFIPGDGHFNPEGCRFVAQLLADHLANQEYLANNRVLSASAALR